MASKRPRENDTDKEKQDTSPSSCVKRRFQCFRKEYTEEYSFILPGKNADTCAFCSICNVEFSIKSSGLYEIRRHIAGKKHASLEKEKASSKKIVNFFSTPSTSSTENLEVIRAEVMLVDIITELNLPMSALDTFNKAFKTMFKSLSTIQNFQCGRSKGTAILKEIAAQTTLDLKEKMKNGLFTISTDGSNDIGSYKLFPLVIRTADPISFSVTSDILAVPVCEGSATGVNIFNLIKNEFSIHNIPWENCIGLGCDNAPVMTGIHKGVYGLMVKENPSLFLSGCACHLIHIAAEKGASCLTLNVNELLIDVYYYLDKSSKRQSTLRHMQILHDVKESKILKHVSTRWLSIGKCLQRLVDNWEPLYNFFKEEEKSSNTKGDKVTKLRKIFSSPTNRLTCYFLLDAIKPFDEIITILQTDAPLIHTLKRQLERLLRNVLLNFVKPSAMLYKRATEIQFELDYNQKKDTDLLIGQAASDFISKKDENHLRDERIQEFYSEVKQFFITSAKYIKDKLPLQDELLKHAEIVDPTLQVTANVSSLEYFLKRFPTMVPPEFTVADCKLEFAKYQATDIQSCLNDTRVDHTWGAISQLKEEGGKEPCLKVLPKIMTSILTIPHSSAHCERIFSLVRKNKTEFRSNLNPETVEALLIAKCRQQTAIDRTYSDKELKNLKSAYFKSLKPTQN